MARRNMMVDPYDTAPRVIPKRPESEGNDTGCHRMNKEKAAEILICWLVASKGAEEQLGYIEGWFDKEDEEAFLLAIEALKDDWIPVSERPPEVGECVLMSNGEWTAEGYYKDNGQWHQFRSNWDYSEAVIAWKPMPEPYNADKRGGKS